ncbi:hypothetical protein Zmor_002874 [Zophobas morio]|uniref:Fibronectin type-III domain-containing protein n=1 Tax=Zophobas morio TaxID=2755281 RepID=A0AA38M0S0_9CUCU|nr:hypothetical protein Zmor_002874 [Zophobas morio]
MGLKRYYGFCYIKILLLVFVEVVLPENVCSPGLGMPGYTIPRGDIAIEFGSPLDITCVIVNTSSQNASLSFTRNSKPIPGEMIDVINGTTIKLHVDNPPLVSGDQYTCVLDKQTSVCMNRVSVGIKPQKVTDFSCISYNYDNLTCSWTTPNNYVRTDYNLTFTLGEGRAARYVYLCPAIVSVDNRSSCFWNISTTPHYRLVHENFNFTLTMNNTFGTNQINEHFNHFAHVLSGPPEKLKAESATASSILLSWVVPLSMQTFPPGVHHRILYQCEYDEKKWKYGDILLKQPHKKVTYNLTGLPYAHALCDIRVSLRSAKALPSDESMWSRNASITFRTSSKIPDEPPLTDVGSFEVVAFGNKLQNREAYIYWKQIREEQKNGPEFRYEISCEEEPELKPSNVTNTYAKFNELSISKSYTFHIWSKNVDGSSLRRSTVRVPKQADRVKEPIRFTKVEFSEGNFELTWEPPELLPTQYITNYTIFSCTNERDRPYQCTGLLNWTVVSSSTTTVNMKVDKSKIFQFAIAANTRESSSGMLWAACTIIHNKNMGKLKNVWINRVGPTFIELGWKLDCTDGIGSVEGYIVYFCPIKSPLHSECKAPQANTTFGDTTISRGNITGLNPYTTYMLTISVITKHTTFSQQSDPLYNTTLEAAPSHPQNLTVVNVTNSTITVGWQPPAARNGVLKFYELEIVGNSRLITNRSESTQTSFTFENLTSYEDYTISLAACTVMCSDKVITRNKTAMGRPNKIAKPTVDRRNGTSITIAWNRPSQPGGNSTFYLVRLRPKDDNKVFEYNTTGRTYVLQNCGDGGKYNTFYVSVKAINKIKGTDVDGPWSDELENYCYRPINYVMYLLLVLAIAGLISVGFLFTRLYHRCKIMQDVEVKLPPGLAPVVADHTLVPWSTEKHQESRTPHSPPDEELLLVKMSEGRNFSGDSSGCSSGHESVTSSLESGTHISSSADSGTEQPGNYCALGVNPKVVDSSYIPVTVDAKEPYKRCDDLSDSSPYVMTGEAVKTINPGYIPFNQTEPIEKNSGYVVAGIKNVNGYIPFNQTDTVSRNTGYVVAGIKNCKLD